MEEFAGTPKQAMGFRTPGEKTAYEVQSLESAASRIFQEKIGQFEIEMLEPLLNLMLESARRNLVGSDIIRVMDDDLGVIEFMNITKDDITAKGKIRPTGARHFAATAQLVQNITNLFNSPVGQMIAPHTSAKQLSKLVEDVLGLERFDLFQDNVAIMEQADSQRIANQAQPYIYLEDQEVGQEMAKFFESHFWGGKILAAGKNFASFDKPFLEALPDFTDNVSFNHRSIDPAMLFWKLEDKEIPDFKTCLERAGIHKKVEHTALADALDVVKLLRVAAFGTVDPNQ